MKPAMAAQDDFHRRFLREAQLAASIEHEHVVTVYQVDEDNGIPYLAMKLLQGESLEERLRAAAAGCSWTKCCALAARLPRVWQRPTKKG